MTSSISSRTNKIVVALLIVVLGTLLIGCAVDKTVGKITGSSICLDSAKGGFVTCVEIEFSDKSTLNAYCGNPIPCQNLALGQKVRIEEKYTNYFVIVEIIEGDK